jgi:methylphosphotriester-DNA--protein-cysteine methyltransferase
MPGRRKIWTLTGADGEETRSGAAGRFGGHRGTHIYGRLDCPAALRAIARGGYVKYRVFFRDAATARAAGYRPCAVCLPKEYARWKSSRKSALKPRRAG